MLRRRRALNADGSSNAVVLVERSDYIDPESNQYDAVDEAPHAPKVSIWRKEESISNDLYQRLDGEKDCERHVCPYKPIPNVDLVCRVILSLV